MDASDLQFKPGDRVQWYQAPARGHAGGSWRDAVVVSAGCECVKIRLVGSVDTKRVKVSRLREGCTDCGGAAVDRPEKRCPSCGRLYCGLCRAAHVNGCGEGE